MSDNRSIRNKLKNLQQELRLNEGIANNTKVNKNNRLNNKITNNLKPFSPV